MYLKVLECVEEKVVCVTSGIEQCFENGKVAIQRYESEIENLKSRKLVSKMAY